MPEISRFFGIIIAMHYNDHAPPHFHARYGGDQAIIAIETLHVLGGRLGPRVMVWWLNGPYSTRTTCWRIGDWRARALL